MNTIKISLNEQLILRNNARLEIERLENILNNIEIKEKLDLFKNKFNICESAYKVILAEHQRKKGNIVNYLKLQMTQVPYALQFAGYTFDKKWLNELFGSKSKKGKTVKKLRDEITHGIKKNAVDEIITREKELFAYMDTFINVIKNYDLIVS